MIMKILLCNKNDLAGNVFLKIKFVSMSFNGESSTDTNGQERDCTHKQKRCEKYAFKQSNKVQRNITKIRDNG